MPAFNLFLPPQSYARWNPARRPCDHPILRLRAASGLIAQWIERTRQRHALARLEDRMLRDMGITRVDVMRECEKPFWR